MADPAAQGASRVVLLARAGKAADNLADAVRQAGAELLLCVDPANTDEATLRALAPQALLVALEPSVEASLDNLDALLVDPGLSVIFDEADVAAHRSGWEAARWVRHLSAKLRRDDNVLPPGTESDTHWQPSPGQVPKPSAAYADVDMTRFTQEAVAVAASVPADGDPVLAAPAAPVASAPVAPAPVASAPEPLSMPPEIPAIDLSMLDAIPAAPALDIATPVASQPAAMPPAAMPPAPPPLPASPAPVASAPVAPAPVAPAPVAPAPEPASPGLLDDVMRELAMLQQQSAPVAPSPAPVAPPPLPLPSFEHLSLEPMAFETPAPSSPTFDASSGPDAGAHHDFAIEQIPLDDLPHEPLPARESDSTIAPMQFDDDAFFLQELSASGDAASAEPLSFDGGLDLSGLQLDAMTFDDAPERPSTFVPRDPEPVMSLEDLIASSLHQADNVPAGSASPIPAGAMEAPAPAVPPPLPSLEPAPAASAPAEPRSTFSFGDLSLAPVDDGAPAAPATAAPAPAAKPAHDLSSLEARISGLSLLGIEEEEKPAGALFGLELPGVVLIEAGLGGPDPARQLLSAIPAAFPAIVLVRLHLQGGRYDRLVAQMERASALPVALAESGATANPGSIYFLPEGIGVVSAGAKLRFEVEAGDSRTIFAALPANNSAVVFLSGSDPRLVDVAMAVAATGTMIAAQTPEDCYDGVACTELRTRGAPSGLPSDLAGRLATRWPSH